jgi:hypothetical protein
MFLGDGFVKLNDKILLSDEVVAREVGEETMLLDLASGTYFGLDAVGGWFWQMLEEGKSPLEARDALLEKYDVGVDQLEQDLEALLANLAEHGLITAED